MRQLIQAEQNPSAISSPKEITFAELAAQWREKFFGPPLALATVKRKTFVLEKHVLPALGHLPLAGITPAAILERLLKPLEARRGLLETALWAREMTGAIFRFCIASALTDRGYPNYTTSAISSCVLFNVTLVLLNALDVSSFGNLDAYALSAF